MIQDTSAHRHAWDQIPWLVNGSLPEGERQAVQIHLDSCADCRAELEFQRLIATSLEKEPFSNADPHASWRILQTRIVAAGHTDPAPAGRSRIRAALSGQWVPWLVAAMIVQAIGLGALGAVIWSKPGNPAAVSSPYRTLSAAESGTGTATIRVVFAPDLTVGNMQRLLQAAGLQVQSGPSSAGVWSLEPARDSSRAATQSALQELRDNTGVRFAEAIAGAQ
jgi:anti-sigma factor RsiW